MTTVPISPGGGSSNDTTAVQNAINTTAQQGNILEFQPGTFNVDPLLVPSGAHLVLLSGTTIYARSGFVSNAKLVGIDGSNIIIEGAGASVSKFQMRKSEYPANYNQATCIFIDGKWATGGAVTLDNITVRNVSGNDSGGDGIYVHRATNVTIEDCIFNNNRRTGCAITGWVNHLNISRCQFTNTSGSDTQDGIDIETNEPTDYLQDVNIIDCTASGNGGNSTDNPGRQSGSGIEVKYFSLTSGTVSVHVQRYHSSGNKANGYAARNSGTTNPSGTILFEDCTSDGDGYCGVDASFYASNGAALIFKNLQITNPHVVGPQPVYSSRAAVLQAGGGGGAAPLGNLHLLHVGVSAPNGQTDRYFDLWSAVGGGVANVQFVPGTLSGATNAASMGQVNGVNSEAIH